MAQSRTLRQKLRNLFTKTKQANPVDLTGKNIIVTGASRDSLGFATAKILASWGANVVITCRHDADSTALELRRSLASRPAQIEGHNLDLCDPQSVHNFVSWYQEKHGERLDVLINNAGIHLDLMSKWTSPRCSSDGEEIHYRTNYLGTVHLTNCLLPLLMKTGEHYGDARIVNVVSQLHNRGSNTALFDPHTPYNSWRAYGLSKLATIHFTYELQRRYANTHHLQSYCLHPGGRSGTFTNIANKGLEGHRLINALRRVATPIERLFMASPEEGAQTQIHCSTAKGLPGGHYYVDCAIAESSIDCSDAAVSKRLWDHTNEWLKTIAQ